MNPNSQSNPNVTRVNNIFETRDPRQEMARNQFDWSKEHRTTFKMGRLVPIYVNQALPGDKFELRTEILLRFAALRLPIYHRINVSVDWFFVPNNIIWTGTNNWQDFISRENSSMLWAHTVINPNNIDENSLCQYMGISISNLAGPWDTDRTFNVLPIAAYVKIWDEFYRNPTLQSERFVDVTAGDNTPSYGTVWEGEPYLINWNRDYFTSATPLPQEGTAIQVPIVGENDQGPRQVRSVSSGAAVGANSLDTGGDGKLEIGGTDVYLDIQETSADIHEFRMAAKLQEYLEKLLRTTTRYRDFIKGFFQTDPSPLAVDDPVFIGGFKGKVAITEVMQTAETITGTSTLSGVVGAYAGQALMLDQSPTFTYECREHGVLMAIACVKPRSSYYQGVPKWMYQYRTALDYMTPQFAAIGDQEIQDGEIYYDWETGGADPSGTWGYIPRYSELRYDQDTVSGHMRTTFLNWHLARSFTSLPLLNASFIELDTDSRVNDCFVLDAETDHEIYAYIWNHVHVTRMLPKFGIPLL